MIDVHELTVVAGGRPRVHAADLRVGAGEIVALVGPNGAGKSTLLAALTGERRATHGRVLLDGTALERWQARDRAARLAVLPQRPEAALGLTVEDVVTLGVELALGVSRADLVRQALGAVDLLDRRHDPAAVLSGGEQQRVHLARVLAQCWAADRPGAVLLDEPISAQDPGRVAQVLRLVHRLAMDGHAVLVVLHDLVAASAVADRVVLLVEGVIEADGPPADVLTAARLTRAYRAPVVVTDGPRGRPVPIPHVTLETS